jgi:hypothetical protein
MTEQAALFERQTSRRIELEMAVFHKSVPAAGKAESILGSL